MSWSIGDEIDTRTLTDLYHVATDGTASNHVWKLFVTDVLDTKAGIFKETFNSFDFYKNFLL